MLHTDTKNKDIKNVLYTSLISGAVAGIACDMIFFPLDTLKTRLQSQHGFNKSGGFKQLYQGFIPVIIGSAPTACLFFVTYDAVKYLFQPYYPIQYHSIIHMGAASLAELVACLIRVPVEVLKQRQQALIKDAERLKLRTLFRGYSSTALRDLPFGLIQMPLWEYFKLCWRNKVYRECTAIEGATCGAASVAVSTALTTPLDVAKTRIMLSASSADKKQTRISVMFKEIYKENGFRGLFAGFFPRVCGFTMAGFVFFGIYEQIRELCKSKFNDQM